MSDKKVKCPWCETVDVPVQVSNIQSGVNTIVERRCELCGKIIASYVLGEGDFLPKIRVFESK
jgi:phage FluMu protein Com